MNPQTESNLSVDTATYLAHAVAVAREHGYGPAGATDTPPTWRVALQRLELGTELAAPDLRRAHQILGWAASLKPRDPARDFRLPELFCGFQRDGSRAIVAYPFACIPQAWAATAPFMLLQSMLGISAHAPHSRLTVDRPRLPDRLGAVEVRGIRVGSSKVSLAFRQTGLSTAFSLVEQQGDVRVTMST